MLVQAIGVFFYHWFSFKSITDTGNGCLKAHKITLLGHRFTEKVLEFPCIFVGVDSICFVIVEILLKTDEHHKLIKELPNRSMDYDNFT